MHHDLNLLEKLEEFIRKYHRSEILRGVILFLSICLFSFTIFLLVEYFLWLSISGRKFLYWSFIILVGVLFYKLIFIPISKLFKLKQGLTYEESAKIIGEFYPELSDKVINTLQLYLSEGDSELLIASVSKKMEEMSSFSFLSAVSYSDNKKYLRFFSIPFILLFFCFLVFDTGWFGSSYKRLTNYNLVYSQPDPYSFFILNDSLNVIEGQDFYFKFSIEGKRIPYEVSLFYNDNSYVLKADREGVYTYVFHAITEDVFLSITGNNQVTSDYVLKVLPIPFIEDIILEIKPPAYTKIASSFLNGSGSAEVPEGSIVSWIIKTNNADSLYLLKNDTVLDFTSTPLGFILELQSLSSFNYSLQALNINSNQKENINYQINVIKDNYPSIIIDKEVDELEPNNYKFSGVIHDDFGFKSLNFTVFPSLQPSMLQSYSIPISEDINQAFQFYFDTNQFLKEDTDYIYYFEVIDNDAINRFKSTKSDFGNMFSPSLKSLKDTQLNFQKDKLDILSNSFNNPSNPNTELENSLNLLQFNESVLWNDLQSVKSFAKQESMSLDHLQKITEDLLSNLNTQDISNSNLEEKNQLESRMEEQIEHLVKNKELLESIDKYQSKIAKDSLQQQLEDYKKNKQIQENNLAQLLELTKRFYVTEKNNKLSSDLMDLGLNQVDLPEENIILIKKQQQNLQDSFHKFQSEFETLMKENQSLLKPFDLFQDKGTESRIVSDQQEALNRLIDSSIKDSRPFQQTAGQKMQELAKSMKRAQSTATLQSVAENAGVLRQILDNLVRFSFSQEEILNIFSSISFSNPKYGSFLTNQYDLKHNFKHINDSLFSLSLRQPTLGKEIHQLAIEIDDHINVALDDLAQNRISNGLTQLQYSLSSSNELASILSDILANMQLQMSSSDSNSKDSSSQLSDIIEKQKSLLDTGDFDGVSDESRGNTNNDFDNSKDINPTNSYKGIGSDYIDSIGEDDSFYELYQSQQELKLQLETLILNSSFDLNILDDALEQMELLSISLLDLGSTEANKRQMHQILHKLIELHSSTLQQEVNSDRISNTNFNHFSGSSNQLQTVPQHLLPSYELIKTQSFPLSPFYIKKVKDFFE